MRIIGGNARGRRLCFPSGSKQRPTSDFLRESLFNLLGSLEGKTFLDLFAGSGSVGLEAVSRGAQCVYFVEKDYRLAEVIKKNINACSFATKCFVITKDVETGLSDIFKKNKMDIVFADPPYNKNMVGTTISLLNKYQVSKDDILIVIQHSIKENIAESILEKIHLVDQRKYGENNLTFFKWRKNDSG
jgi:16S rRNA (guanine966-N2)-methyltransferase